MVSHHEGYHLAASWYNKWNEMLCQHKVVPRVEPKIQFYWRVCGTWCWHHISDCEENIRKVEGRKVKLSLAWAVKASAGKLGFCIGKEITIIPYTLFVENRICASSGDVDTIICHFLCLSPDAVRTNLWVRWTQLLQWWVVLLSLMRQGHRLKSCCSILLWSHWESLKLPWKQYMILYRKKTKEQVSGHMTDELHRYVAARTYAHPCQLNLKWRTRPEESESTWNVGREDTTKMRGRDCWLRGRKELQRCKG